jgi:hypothetical protein
VKTLLHFLPVPLFCLGFLFISAVVLFLFLRRLTSTLQQTMQNVEELENKVPSQEPFNDQPSSRPPAQGESAQAQTCPACGGEVPAGASACPYCGTKF